MKKSNDVLHALKIIKALSEVEREAIVNEIMEQLGGKAATGVEQDISARCGTIVEDARPQRPDCPHCVANADLGYVVKDGVHHGSQRYRCKTCGKKFVATTNTVFARSHKDADTWRKFIEMTLSRKSLAACAEECRVCIQTAFDWRHKILNVFAVNQKSTKMAGVVEVDEMLIPLSYKGNHIQSGWLYRRKEPGAINDMPRKAFKRGTDNVSRSPGDKACVFCMVEANRKVYYTAVPGVGYMSETTLSSYKEMGHA